MFIVRLFFFFNDTATTEIYTLSPTRRSSDLRRTARPKAAPSDRPRARAQAPCAGAGRPRAATGTASRGPAAARAQARSEEHTSELQSRQYLVCRLLLEKKKQNTTKYIDAAEV